MTVFRILFVAFVAFVACLEPVHAQGQGSDAGDRFRAVINDGVDAVYDSCDDGGGLFSGTESYFNRLGECQDAAGKTLLLIRKYLSYDSYQIDECADSFVRDDEIVWGGMLRCIRIQAGISGQLGSAPERDGPAGR